MLARLVMVQVETLKKEKKPVQNVMAAVKATFVQIVVKKSLVQEILKTRIFVVFVKIFHLEQYNGLGS